MLDIFKPQVFDFTSYESLIDLVTKETFLKILDTNSENGVVRLAISGGSSIPPILKKLSKEQNLPWNKLSIYQTDERFVPADSLQNNWLNLAQAFAEDILPEIGELNPIKTDIPLAQSVIDYQEKLDSEDVESTPLEENNLFDLVLLGVGPDGHIASLFPGSQYLSHQEKKVVATTAPPEFEVAQRISLTIETLLNSSEIFLVITGKNKETVLKEMLEGKTAAKNFPVKFLLAHPKLSIFHFPN